MYLLINVQCLKVLCIYHEFSLTASYVYPFVYIYPLKFNISELINHLVSMHEKGPYGLCGQCRL